MRILVGLGGNQGDVAAAFVTAASSLARTCRVVARSRLWRTAAVGPVQPDFLNAVLLLELAFDPLRLLACAQRIELDAGRDRRCEIHRGPRPLDVDLLLAPGLIVEAPALVLPHPRFCERRFALLPASELAPDWVHPRLHRSVADLAASLDAREQRCEAIGAFPTWRT